MRNEKRTAAHTIAARVAAQYRPKGGGRAPRQGVVAALASAVAALVLGGCAAAPAGERIGCEVDLLVQFSPSVARPASAGFLQSIVQGSGYDLRYVRRLGNTLLLRMTGPDTTCDEGIAMLRRHVNVRSVDVDERQFRHQMLPKPEA